MMKRQRIKHKRHHLLSIPLLFLLAFTLQQTLSINSHIPAHVFYTQNKPYEELYRRLQQIQSWCPTAKLQSFARTHRNLGVPLLTIGSSQPHAPTLLLTAGMHGRERSTTLSLMYTTEKLCHYLKTHHSSQSILLNIRILIAPLLNPDGAQRAASLPSGVWRKNCRPLPSKYKSKCDFGGVDLNRNWPAFWAKGNGTSTNPCHDQYVGPAPLSEPETAGLTRVIMSHPYIRLAVDFHSYGALLLRGWAYKQTHSLEMEVEKRQKLVARAMRMAVIQNVGTQYFDVNARFIMTYTSNRTFGGTYHDFMMQRGIPCVSVELPPKPSKQARATGYNTDHNILTRCKEVKHIVWTAINAVYNTSHIPQYSDQQIGIVLP